MNDATELNKNEPEVKPWTPWWRKSAIALWDRRLLIPSLIVGLAVYAWCSYQIKIHTPPEGYVFEQLEPLTGVYKCCGDEGGRSSQSWVDGAVVTCDIPKYYGGQRYTACGFKDELSDKVITVKRVLYPVSYGQESIVTELIFDGRSYYQQTDRQIRNQWVHASEGAAQSNALGAFLLTYLIALFIYDRKLKNQGDKK